MHFLRLVKKASHVPQTFFNLLLLSYILVGLFVMLSLEGQGFSLLSPSGSPTVELLIFNVPAVKSH